MGHPSPLLDRRLGAPDVEAAVDLQAVAGDDLAALGESEAQAERALARGGRADERDQERRRHSRHTVHSRASARRMTAPRICWRVTSFSAFSAGFARLLCAFCRLRSPALRPLRT